MKYKLVIFDLDGTLVDGTVFIWRSIYNAFLPHISHISLVEEFRKKKISYSEWFFRDLENFRAGGVTKEKILSLIDDFSVMPGAKETVEILRKKGVKVAVISGSISIVADAFFDKGTFDDLFINEIFFDSFGNISGGLPTEFDMQHKAEGLAYLARKYKIPEDAVLFVGDNENDVEIAQRAGFSIAFNSSSALLSSVCAVEIKEKDISNILKYVI